MNKKTRSALFIILCVFLIAALYLFVRPKGQIELDSGHRVVMGTFARVVAVANNSNTAKKSIEAAFAEIQKVDDLMSDYKNDSEISIVNRDAFNRQVKISKSTFEVLQKSIEFSRLTNGAFDITVGPLVDLWHLAAESNAVPSKNELRETRSKVGYEKLILDANELTVRFKVKGMRIDLGGIAKGYAIDKAIEATQSAGAAGAMVDIGGDIRCFGRPMQGKNHWLIGLQDPNLVASDPWPVTRDVPLLILRLKDDAVATSGSYRRFTLIDGRKYSHIINRRTGTSTEGLSSVTVISKNAMDADALATAVSVMGAEKGLALIETIPQTEAILISSQPKQEFIKTTGAEKYITSK
jgi:thiamine biosynthesis lipoprotein